MFKEVVFFRLLSRQSSITGQDGINLKLLCGGNVQVFVHLLGDSGSQTKAHTCEGRPFFAALCVPDFVSLEFFSLAFDDSLSFLRSFDFLSTLRF